MRTLLADDNAEIRAALRLLLEELGEHDIVEAGDLTQALAVTRDTPFDVVLLDWDLPAGGGGGGDSAEFVQELARKVPGCRVIAMSGRPESHPESVRAGCEGFVSRNEPPDKLLALLEAGRQGAA